MIATEDNTGSRFIVDLGDIRLPLLLERQVEAEIQSVVLRALAESDVGADRKARASGSIWDRFPGRTLGLWYGDEKFPPILVSSRATGPLTVRDHTLIMKTVMEHPMLVLKHLPAKLRTKGGDPSGTEVLQAVLQIDQIDDYVKGRVQMVLDLLPKIEEGRADMPESFKRAIDGIRSELSKRTTVKEKCGVLRDAGLRRMYHLDGLAEGMEIAAQMLEDGQDSIYSPDHRFYQMLKEGSGGPGTVAKDVVGDIANNDEVGGVAGALIGTAAAGIGAVPGGLAGAASASAGAAIQAVFDWLFG